MWFQNNENLTTTCQVCPRQSLVTGLHTGVSTMLKCKGMQNSIKIYGVVQELWAFSLNSQGHNFYKLKYISHEEVKIVPFQQ